MNASWAALKISFCFAPESLTPTLSETARRCLTLSGCQNCQRVPISHFGCETSQTSADPIATPNSIAVIFLLAIFLHRALNFSHPSRFKGHLTGLVSCLCSSLQFGGQSSLTYARLPLPLAVAASSRLGEER